MRVHTGTLSEDDVRHNYLTDVPAYRAGGYAVWNDGTGYWNDPLSGRTVRSARSLDAVPSRRLADRDQRRCVGQQPAMLDLRASTSS